MNVYVCDSGDTILGIKPGDTLQIGVEVDGESMPDMVQVAGKYGLFYDGKLDFGVGDKPKFTLHGSTATLEMGDLVSIWKLSGSEPAIDLLTDEDVDVDHAKEHVKIVLAGTRYYMDVFTATMLMSKLDELLAEKSIEVEEEP